MAYTMPGNRGGTVLVYNNYRFHKNKVTSTTIHWRCCRRVTCRVHLQTNIFDLNEEEPNVHILKVHYDTIIYKEKQ